MWKALNRGVGYPTLFWGKVESSARELNVNTASAPAAKTL